MIPIIFNTLIDDQSKVPDFDSFVEKHKNMMIAAAYEVLQDHHYAEDAAFEALELIARGFSKIAAMGENAQKAYAYRSARNKAISLENKLNKHKASDLTPGLRREIPVEDREIAAICEETEEDILAECIDKLPPTYKDVLALYAAGDMTAREIAKALSLKRETVKTRLARGKAILKELVEERLKNG